MGKRPKTMRQPRRQAAADGPSSSASRDAMPPVTTPTHGLSPPQLTALAILSVGAASLASLRRAVVFDGVGSKLCDEMYSDQSGDKGGCSEVDVFLVMVRYHRSSIWMGILAVLVLLCWSDPPLLQRLNVGLCISPLSSTLAAMMVSADAINRGYAFPTTGTAAATIGLGLLSLRVGVAPRRGPRLCLHDAALAAAMAAAVGAAGWVLHAGAGGLLIGFDDADLVKGGVGVQLALLFVDQLTRAVLTAFVLFYLDDVRKRVTMFVMGAAHLIEIFRHLPEEKAHLRDIDVELMNNILFGTAVTLLFFSVLPSRASVKAS